MTSRRIAAINGIVFFFFWVLVLLSGADKPPPLGFLWLAAAVAICAAVVFWRVPTYIDWYRSQRPGRLWRVALEGLAAGLVVAIPFVLKGSGEPSITVQPIDYAIWFAILGMMGVLNSMSLYLINALVARRMDARGQE